mmetsp:Transcript_39273/g.97260  ORF Transcript_39273/g.97260 Transcript_39273/m.97260 type:complete len:202 (-) Transcript_39273:53-658(-)
MEVVVLAEDVSRDDSSEVHPVLRLVHTVLHIHHTLSISVALVGGVRRAVVNHLLVNRKRGLVREYAGGQTRHKLLDTSLVALLENIVVHHDVVPPKLHLMLHVRKQASNLSSQVDDVSRLVLLEDGGRLDGVGQVPVLAAQEHPRLASGLLSLDHLLDGLPHQARASGDHHNIVAHGEPTFFFHCTTPLVFLRGEALSACV